MTMWNSKQAAADAATNTDQLEASAVEQGIVPLEDCLSDDQIALDDLAERYGAAQGPELNEDWATNDSAKEEALADVVTEIKRRRQLLAGNYPFQLAEDGRSLEYLSNRSRSTVYEFCLAISNLSPGERLNRMPCAQVPRVFERLTGRLLAAFLGGNAENRRIGAPPDGDRPGTISETLKLLNNHTGEWEFDPPRGTDAQAEQGDGGIDLAIWKRVGIPQPADAQEGDMLGDDRVGMLVLLAQCACGDNWTEKTKDLSPEGFQRTWCGTISFAGQIRCMAIPHHVPHDADWQANCSHSGLLLDRVRLTWLAESLLTHEQQQEVRQEVAPHLANLRAPYHPPPAPVPRSAAGAVRPRAGKTQRRSP
jgi:hypothetical protein